MDFCFITLTNSRIEISRRGINKLIYHEDRASFHQSHHGKLEWLLGISMIGAGGLWGVFIIFTDYREKHNRTSMMREFCSLAGANAHPQNPDLK